ncbi:prolyl aminopeptidase-like protein [Byssothecium circinans]|uniref:Prolyl aminopeptidase-like protein n=1 Tax=Byssothecium circinans TaxID=147558 RepID=A0A6A5TX86_9PLEO|nr:prolyl aminopeptidase-like protein [Byssothecium circinans]
MPKLAFFTLAITTAFLSPPWSVMATTTSPQPLSLPEGVQQALQWERDQWTDGNVSESEFYTVQADAATATPGSLLKLEEVTNTSAYALPPATALSRFIYQSETLNGTKVPVSAYILWPYAPRESADGYQVVAWAHGTSGVTPNTAPSHHKNLWMHFLAPYNLALQGYVVVATDYAGLGVGKTASGEPILHEYLAAPAHANDAVYSVQAAQQAFPQLGKRFVVIGHSQGGAAAWAAAQRQVVKPVDGYLGAVAVAPVTSILEEPEPIRSILELGVIPAIAAYFPDFNVSDVYTPEGLERSALVRAVEATTLTSLALVSGTQLLQPDWTENPHIRKYQDLIRTGGRAIAQPLLVIKGEVDPNLQYSVAAAAFHDTQGKFPDASIEFIHMPGVSHDAALTSSQRYWMDWIADRFAGKGVNAGGKELQVKAARPLESYQAELNSYLSIATQFYQTG